MRVPPTSVPILALALGACIGSPQPDASAFFLLSPAPAEPSASQVPVRIGVGPVTLPGYLDRPQIVTRVSENQIRLAENDRWAEPLGDNIVRAIEANLSTLLPGSTPVPYPWYPSDAPDYTVALAVRHFEADTSGVVVLDATWTLRRSGEQLDGRSLRVEEQVTAPDRGASVAAHSRALAALSREVASGVRRAAGR
jgi:uncharacterized lipoprotein YmbA